MRKEKKDLNEKSQGKISGQNEAMKGDGRRGAKDDREKSEEARRERTKEGEEEYFGTRSRRIERRSKRKIGSRSRRKFRKSIGCKENTPEKPETKPKIRIENKSQKVSKKPCKNRKGRL